MTTLTDMLATMRPDPAQQGIARQQLLSQPRFPDLPEATPQITLPHSAANTTLNNILGWVLGQNSQQAAASGGSVAPGGLPSGSGVPSGFTSGGDNPWGIDPNGMDLLTRHGATLDADAIASLRQARHTTGINPWQYIGGSYRSPEASQQLYDARHDAQGNLLPGVLPAAPAGSSMHNYGLAFDQSGTLPQALQNYLLANGWYNGASWGDPPHWSYGRAG